MRAVIEKVGDQFGLLIPKEMLDQCGFKDEATVTVQNGNLVITPVAQKSREGWAAAIDAIPEAEIDRDFTELEDFRELPDGPGDDHRWDRAKE